MSYRKNALDLGFTCAAFPETHHICMIFDDEEQRQKIVAEYLAAGLRRGELIRFITDVTTPEQIHAWFLDLGVEIEGHGAFNVLQAENFYFPGGCFDPQKMIDGMLPRFELARKAGYSGVRSCGEMSWMLSGVPGSDRLLEYEALLNTVGGTFPHTGMCLYDARLFDGATLFNVLQVHPYMVAQGQIVRNPYYTKPEEVVQQFAAQTYEAANPVLPH